jgi:hypothetical protein
MKQDHLLARLTAQEDAFVERKSQGIGAQDIRKAVSAFANSLPEGHQGVVFIGVGDKGEIHGVDVPDALQKRVRAACGGCYPPLAPQTMVLTVEGKDIVAVLVGASADRPHFTGPAYVRQGSESVQASKSLFDEMVDARHSTVAAVLRLVGLPITVFAIGHRMGQLVHVQGDYRESAECKVTACDAHMVTLLRLNDSWEFYEPVSRIEVSRDGRMKRPALVVRG